MQLKTSNTEIVDGMKEIIINFFYDKSKYKLHGLINSGAPKFVQ